MVQHRGGDAGFLDDVIAVAEHGDPAQVEVHRAHRAAVDDQCRVAGIVGDTVENVAQTIGFRIDAVGAAVDDFCGWDDVIRGAEHVEDGAVGAFQAAADDEADLAFKPRLAEAAHGNFGPGRVEHVGHQRAVVGLGDVGLALHRP
jgi:hypothetical protein